jgi:hypothetical protein
MMMVSVAGTPSGKQFAIESKAADNFHQAK